MVRIKSSKAIGSFLGRGTHVWLEIITADGTKTTFSGAKGGTHLGVIKNYKKDYDRPSTRGTVVIPPPYGMSQDEWDTQIITAGDKIIEKLHKKYLYKGFLPYGKNRGNCCTIINAIVEEAGGQIPHQTIQGWTPSLGYPKGGNCILSSA